MLRHLHKIALISLLLITTLGFSQRRHRRHYNQPLEMSASYLDSIKKTFVRHRVASHLDSLWLEKSTQVYNELSEDIQNINLNEDVDYEDLPTETLNERLQAMDRVSPFKIEYNKGLENIIKSFLKNRKRSFERLMGISEYYFPMFEEAFSKKNVPLEIKYLAIVESALNPNAVSRSGAAGLWQFMYQTGKEYGLNINSYIDERRDPLKASEAAAQYMANMYAIFGDWDLVLASYNSGPGNVTKAIRRSGGEQNYWKIREKLPRETQAYVPAFLATMYICEYHKEHRIVPERSMSRHLSSTDTIQIKRQMSFKQVAKLIDISQSELRTLNPSYKLGIIPDYNATGKNYLRLPKDAIAVFTSNEDKIYAYVDKEADLTRRPFEQKPQEIIAENDSTSTNAIEIPEELTYRVRRGDNIGSIAIRHRVSVKQIRMWNGLSKRGLVARGDSIKIRKTSHNARLFRKLAIAREQDLAEANSRNKENQNGEEKRTNLSDATNTAIAGVLESQTNAEGAKPEEVLDANGLPVTPKREDVLYTFQKGDRLSTIARKFGTSVLKLKQWNTIIPKTDLTGQILIVAKEELAIVPSNEPMMVYKTKDQDANLNENTSVEYYVKRGDSLDSISRKAGVSIADLRKWNNLKGKKLRPGMKLKINNG